MAKSSWTAARHPRQTKRRFKNWRRRQVKLFLIKRRNPPEGIDQRKFDLGWSRVPRADGTIERVLARTDPEFRQGELNHQILMAEQIETDFAERMGTLRNVPQDASTVANVIGLMLVALGLVAQTKLTHFFDSQSRHSIWLIGVGLILLIKTHTPKFWYSHLTNYVGPGAWAKQVMCRYDYVNLRRKSLLARNNITQHMKRRMSKTAVLMSAFIIALCAFISLK